MEWGLLTVNLVFDGVGGERFDFNVASVELKKNSNSSFLGPTNSLPWKKINSRNLIKISLTKNVVVYEMFE